MKLLKSKRGEIAIEQIAILFCSLAVISVFLHIVPVVVAKQQLNTYADELCRTAEISGRVGSETAERTEELNANTGITPNITWSEQGQIQLNSKFTVTCTVTKDIGLFGSLGSFPVNLKSTASGRSEMYWK